MKNSLSVKILAIGALVLLLLIPLLMIQGVITDRTHYRAEAFQSVSASWTGSQNLSGPILIIPYIETEITRVKDKESSEYREIENKSHHNLYILPEQLKVRADVDTETRVRGLYSVPVYHATIRLSGEFSNVSFMELARSKGRSVQFGKPRLAMAISDLRGAVQQPRLEWDGESHVFQGVPGYASAEGGMSAELGKLSAKENLLYPFRIDMEVRGMENLSFVPTGKDTVVEMETGWPHPSFVGRYLPVEHEIGDDGFSAKWMVSSFSSAMRQAVEELETGSGELFFDNSFGVALVNPVDVYQQSERSVKYGILFIGLTFTAFFTMEIIKRLRVHPVQYLLVGAALTIFYLLLLSLSEHLPFAIAYLIAGGACCGLVGIYAGSILKSGIRGAGFFAYLVLLYGMLYAILLSEDNALLMGSTLLFAVLSLVMYATRKINWYGVTDQLASSDGDPVL